MQKCAESMGQIIETTVNQLIEQLPDARQLSHEQRRSIIAKYDIILQGNFITWMTAAYLGTISQEAREVISGNLLEEIQENHPGMLRRFTVAAKAEPSAGDYLTVSDGLQAVRNFIGNNIGLKTLLTLAFFEKFICKFMPYLAQLALLQGSSDFEYTDVHGPLDELHSAALFACFVLELEKHLQACPNLAMHAEQLGEGIYLLSALLHDITHSTKTTCLPIAV